MRRCGSGCSPVVASILLCSTGAYAEDLWVLPKGEISVLFDQQALDRFGLEVPMALQVGDVPVARLEFAVGKSSDVAFVVENDRVTKLLFDRLELSEGLQLVSRTGETVVFDLTIVGKDDELPTATTSAPDTADRDITLDLAGVRAAFSKPERAFVLPSESLLVSAGLAGRLGDSRLAGVRIGSLVVRGVARSLGGDRTNLERPAKGLVEVESGGTAMAAAPEGPDVTFCELYNLQQYGRLDDIVGLAIATTSWNVGTEDVIWFNIPDERHPFIVQNLFRLKDDRFEQIGQSWVKHGFFALASEQCDTDCTFEPGHGVGDWLGQGCTDTYSSSLNASQPGLGPRHETNPWNGSWEYTGSHMDPNSGPPPHNTISHRLQVHDDDLDPAMNGGASYFTEGYYVMGDDDDVWHMNNASWKPVTPQGAPGFTWTFSMSGFSTPPTIGFAIDAWTGAQQTVIAQELPVLERSSPDGRCILAAKTTDLGGGVWHYEYAMVNIDMNRKVGSFSVPIRPGTIVTNVGFHAVRHHDEPYSNDSWTSSVESDAVVWTTTNNPLRWGTLYNFRFNADVPPFDTTITVGLFEPGTPSTLDAGTTGPDVRDPNCTIPEGPLEVDAATPKNRYMGILGNNPGESTAMRVKLVALMRDPDAAAAAIPASQFSPFEGKVRWLGPPVAYDDGLGGTFKTAALQCDPHFMDWNAAGPVYAYGAEVLPDSTYDAQELHESCVLSIEDEQVYSAPATVRTAHWGDVVSPYGTLSNPQGQPNFVDIATVVDSFRGVPGEISKARGQLQPNAADPLSDITFADVSTDVDAFRGLGYPFVGPSTCP